MLGPADLPSRAPDAAILAERLAEVARVAPSLADSLQRLDPWQQWAATCAAPRAVVRAQVGSGKTAVLAHRVLYLHLVRGVALRDMAVATFTTRAAQQLVERVSGLLSRPAEPQDYGLFGTLHGVCRTLLQLRLPLQNLGWQPDFRVVDEDRATALLTDLVRAHGLRVQFPNQLRARLGQWRRTGQSLRAGVPVVDDLARLATIYDAEKRARNVMDFDDLIGAAAALLRADSGQLVQALVVDELQDCAPAEVELLTALAPRSASFFAVGDPNQSIYGWRGSDPFVFGTLSESLQCSTFDLPNNYRSTPEILSAARATLGKAASGAALNATRPTGARVSVLRHHNPHQEALYLARRLQSLAEAGVAWPRMAVLARTRRQLSGLREVLQSQGIPCAEPPGASWSERPAAAWLLQVLRALPDREPLALRNLLIDKQYGLAGGRELGKPKAPGPDVRAHAALQAQLAALFVRKPDAERNLAPVRDFLERLGALSVGAPAVTAGAAGTAQWLWQALELQSVLRPAHRDYQRDAGHVRAALEQLVEVQALCQDWSAAARLVLDGDPAQQADADGIAMLTLHASKGLEFDHVFLSGCNQGVLPLASAYASPADLAEERRLLFVGLTRARDSAEVSWHMQPALAQGMAMPSEWLLAIPAHSCDWVEQVSPVPTTATPVTALATPVQAADPTWSTGLAVTHAKYGAGTVVGVRDGEVCVEFGKLGEKAFSLLLCPLRRAD